MTITVQHLLAYLLVQAAGELGLDDLVALADLVSSLNAATPSRRVLVDLVAVQTHPTFTEQVRLGSHLAKQLASYKRIAIVPPTRSRPRTIEMAARELGLAQLRIFRDTAAAARWLDEPYAAAPLRETTAVVRSPAAP